MRYIVAVIFSFLLVSCGTDQHDSSAVSESPLDTILRLPSIASGIAVDTSQSELRISWIARTDTSDLGVVDVTYNSVPGAKVLNVYVDSGITTVAVDVLIDAYWRGEDVRLIGMNNGTMLGIPFHGLHRFPPQQIAHTTLPEQYFNLKILANHCEINDWPYHYNDVSMFFAPFYSDAFSPFDSSSKYPSRVRHTVDGLMMEGSAWDGVKFGQGPDSAQVLASYNEFVNKLEIFDKAGPFWTLRVAMIDVTYNNAVRWSQFMKVVSVHHLWLSNKRNSAKQYLSDYIANKGTEPKEFTAEDLRLLYPDRLRWNGFISGEFESRYDADMLTDWQ